EGGISVCRFWYGPEEVCDARRLHNYCTSGRAAGLWECQHPQDGQHRAGRIELQRTVLTEVAKRLIVRRSAAALLPNARVQQPCNGHTYLHRRDRRVLPAKDLWGGERRTTPPPRSQRRPGQRPCPRTGARVRFVETVPPTASSSRDTTECDLVPLSGRTRKNFQSCICVGKCAEDCR